MGIEPGPLHQLLSQRKKNRRRVCQFLLPGEQVFPSDQAHVGAALVQLKPALLDCILDPSAEL